MKRQKMGKSELRRWIALCLWEARNAEKRIKGFKAIAGFSDDVPPGMISELIKLERARVQAYKKLEERFHPAKKKAEN